MIIRQDDKALVQAGLFRVVDHDRYSVVMETQGLAPNLPEAKKLGPRR